MKKTMPFIIALLLVISVPPASAETKTFMKEYTYQAGAFDSRASARTIAFEQVRQMLFEELAAFLETSTAVMDFQMTTDHIRALSAGIVQTEIRKEKWDGKTYWMQATIKADPKKVVNAIDSLRKDREKSKKLEDTNKRVAAVLQKLERDKTQRDRYHEAIKELSAIDWFRKGLGSLTLGNYSEAIAANTKAVQLNPGYTEAYVNRGLAYHNAGNREQALANYNKAVALDPGYALAYLYRGAEYAASGNYREAFEDSSKAIALDPDYPLAYVTRGIANVHLHNHQQALNDANRAVTWTPPMQWPISAAVLPR
jgi:tetratricopeptide (TPR) repeat protein